MSVSPVSASVRRADQLAAGLVELGVGDPLADARRSTRRRCRTRRCSRRPTRRWLGQHELLDAGHRDDEVGRLVGALRGRRERPLVAGRDAGDLLVEVVGDPALADLVGPVLGVEPGDLLAVAGGGEVDDDVVAGGRPGARRRRARRTAALGGDGLVDLVVGGLRRRQLDAQAAVAGHGDLGTHLEGGVEGDRAVLLAAGDLDLGGGDQVDVVLADGLGEVLRDGVAQRLLAGRGEADAGLEHAARRLAGAEPGSRTSRAILRNAWSMSRSNSASSIVTESLTLLPSISCSELFTGR